MARWLGVCALAVMGAACTDDETPSGGAGEGGSGGVVGDGGQPGEGGAGGNPLAALYDCEEAAYTEARALSGPLFDIETGFVGEPQETYVVSTTQIYIPAEQETAFFELLGDILPELSASSGMVAFALGSDDVCGVNRTISVWTSEEAMIEFVAGDAHATAMQATPDVSLSGRTTHWTATAAEVEALSWDVVRAKIDPVEPFY